MAPLQGQRQAMRTNLKVASVDDTDAISRHRRVVCQPNPHNPATPHLRKGCLEQSITGWDHHHTIGFQGGCDFTFRGGDRLPAAKTTDVGCADVGDHRHIRLGAARQAFNFTRTAHAHFNHQGAMVGMRGQHGERNANVVVVVSLAAVHITQGGQGGTNQFTGGGFSR